MKSTSLDLRAADNASSEEIAAIAMAPITADTLYLDAYVWREG